MIARIAGSIMLVFGVGAGILFWGPLFGFVYVPHGVYLLLHSVVTFTIHICLIFAGARLMVCAGDICKDWSDGQEEK